MDLRDFHPFPRSRNSKWLLVVRVGFVCRNPCLANSVKRSVDFTTVIIKVVNQNHKGWQD